jgi:hypothetical protein
MESVLHNIITILWLLLGAVGLIAAIAVAVLFVKSILVQVYNEKPAPVDPEPCMHIWSNFDVNHPDDPWVCNQCGERLK